MKRKTIITTLAALLLGLSAVAQAQMPQPPSLEPEYIPYQPATLHASELSVSTHYNSETQEITYSYLLRNDPTSEQSIVSLLVKHEGVAEVTSSPAGWNEGVAGEATPLYPFPHFTWVASRRTNLLAPGEELTGLSIESSSFPGVANAQTRGYVPALKIGQYYENAEAIVPREQDHINLATVCPLVELSTEESAASLLGKLQPQVEDAQGRGWLPLTGPDGETLSALLTNLSSNRTAESASAALTLLSTLTHQDFDQNGRALLRPYLLYIVARWSSQSIPLSLVSIRDSTLRAKKPHRNEGANPRLFLSHRLDTAGKSQNPIVGFDMSEVDLNGLVSATLVMNIQDCDLPRRWGDNGRFIEAHPVNQDWAEGNGNRYRLNGAEGRTKGEGQGVTWFSPVDDQIRNNRPNGSLMWNGARTAFGPITAPAVQVVNGQTGPIEFDVTQDVLNGNQHGWVLKKQDEGKLGNIRFYSKENGNPDLSPMLILDYGGQSASTDDGNTSLMASMGFGSSPVRLNEQRRGSELPSLRERIRESATATLAGEALIATAVGPNPVVSNLSRTAYRAWLDQGLG